MNYNTDLQNKTYLYPLSLFKSQNLYATRHYINFCGAQDGDGFIRENRQIKTNKFNDIIEKSKFAIMIAKPFFDNPFVAYKSLKSIKLEKIEDRGLEIFRVNLENGKYLDFENIRDYHDYAEEKLNNAVYVNKVYNNLKRDFGFQIDKKGLENFLLTFKSCTKEKLYAKNIVSLVSKKHDINLTEVANYAKQYPLEKLALKFPKLKTFSAEELLLFYGYHSLYTKDLMSENLEFPIDLSNYLSSTHTIPENLELLLNIFPNTDRHVGDLPKSWLADAKDKQKRQQLIIKALDNFADKSGYLINDNDIQHLKNNLSSIFKSEIGVDLIGGGGYGSIYKITAPNREDVCIKIFHPPVYYNGYNYHGPYYEVQNGLFLNNHTDKSVHFYFGKIASYKCKDAYLLTQFLDEKSDKIIKGNNSSEYSINFIDCKDANKVRDLFVDYGGVYIEANNEPYFKHLGFEDLNTLCTKRA